MMWEAKVTLCTSQSPLLFPFFFWHAEILSIRYVECVNHVGSSLYKQAMYQFLSSLFASRLGKEFGCIFFVCNHERSSSHLVVSLLYVQFCINWQPFLW